jgi:hypothetical protein
MLLALGALSAVGNAVLIFNVADEYTTALVALIAILVMAAILFVGMLLGELEPEND